MTSLKYRFAFGLCLALSWMIGCGGGDEPTPAKSASSETQSPQESKKSSPSPSQSETIAETKNVPPPPAAIGGETETAELPEEGTPLWYLLEIRELRGKSGPKDAGLDELRKYRHERNEEIIEMATQVIAQTHSDPKMTEAFNLAVQEFMEARLQNALQGSEEDIATLYEDAESLQKRDPESTSAMTASHTLVRFAHTNAMRYGNREPKWITEFSRKARQFAGQYPAEKAKSLPLLSAAATTADLHDMQEESVACHTLLAEKFADTPQGKFSIGVLRRLNLEGQKLEFAGPTSEGGFINLEDFSDRVVLIAFWRSGNEEFSVQVPELKTLYEKYHSFGFEIIGVCLDEEESDLDTWLEEHGVNWRQIFFINQEQRSWRNPVAQYYGVREVPTMWLVDHNGVVIDANVTAATLEEPLRSHLLQLREKLKSASADEATTTE
ncbi:MAG: TlpA family protein disulfide reductase [Planctomycetaceae bacterium]|nr:TlpA family protein disulfide reductase [Planctomycetaceae bacterium]